MAFLRGKLDSPRLRRNAVKVGVGTVVAAAVGTVAVDLLRLRKKRQFVRSLAPVDEAGRPTLDYLRGTLVGLRRSDVVRLLGPPSAARGRTLTFARERAGVRVTLGDDDRVASAEFVAVG